MEKDQNINPEGQNEEVKETETEEQILEGQADTAERKEEVKETETEDQILEGQADSTEKKEEI
jgi:hypothetical protein